MGIVLRNGEWDGLKSSIASGRRCTPRIGTCETDRVGPAFYHGEVEGPLRSWHSGQWGKVLTRTRVYHLLKSQIEGPTREVHHSGDGVHVVGVDLGAV